MEPRTQTAERVLDAAQGLAQSRGYNAFSYADLASALGIRKASIHHYFPSKGDLARALVARYRRRSATLLAQLDTEHDDPVAKLERYVALEEAMLADGIHVCLCAMFASDVLTLPGPVRDEINDFFADQETWLASVLRDGQTRGRLRFAAAAETEAQLLVAGLQGAMLIARSRRDPTHLGRVAGRMLAALGGESYQPGTHPSRVTQRPIATSPRAVGPVLPAPDEAS